MKTPALLLLSALVALGHWLLLAPGPGLLQALQAQTAPSNAFGMQPAPAPAPATSVRVLQTRRLDSASTPPTASVLQAVHTEPRRSTAAPPRAPKAAAYAPPTATPAPEAPTPETPAAETAAPDTPPAPDPEPTLAAAQTAAEEDIQVGPEALATAVEAPSQTLATPLASPWQLPPSVRLNYDITGQSRGLGYRASGVLDWQQNGSRYDARLVASVFFLGNRVLSSEGEITPEGLAPARFADKSRSERAAHFQPDKGKITFSANTPDAVWQRGAQDRLSVFFQLTGMLSGQPERFVSGTLIPVYTASARGADTWAFQVDGSESLSLPAGDMPALKLKRQNRAEHEQQVEVWFAPSLSYWPVRIKLTQANGDFVDQQLVSVTLP